MKIPAAKVLASVTLGMTLLAAGCSETMSLGSTRSYDQSFLSNYTALQPRGNDLIYRTADSQRLLAAARGIMIDQPEIHIAANSPFTGAKPADLTAIAEAMRTQLVEALKKAGYNVVTEPGPNILFLRLALTDIYLEKEARGVLGYTPIGFVVGAGVDAMESVMQGYNILGITLQAELTDVSSKALIFELVAQRGGNQQVITFDQYKKQMQTWGQRLACQVSNSKLPTAQQTDCAAIGSTG
jgi:hypothetical protein